MSLLGDLGWDSIENTHNERKVKYFDRLINLEAYRWPNLLLNALFHFNDNDVRLRWKWLDSVKGVLINSGLDHIFSTDLPFNPRALTLCGLIHSRVLIANYVIMIGIEMHVQNLLCVIMLISKRSLN